MESKEKTPSRTASKSSARHGRRQKLRTTASGQTNQQSNGGTSNVLTGNPAAAAVAEATRRSPNGSAGRQRDQTAQGTHISTAGGNREHQSRGASGSRAQPTDSVQQPIFPQAERRENLLPKNEMRRPFSGASSSKGQPAQKPSPARNGQAQAPARTCQPPSAGTSASSPHTQSVVFAQRPPSASPPRLENMESIRKGADRSIDAYGYDFGPKVIDNRYPMPRVRTALWPQYRHKAAKMGIGIETEFLLRNRNRPCNLLDVKEFGKVVAYYHNLKVPNHNPRMKSYMENQEISEEGYEIKPEPRMFDEWSLTFDPTMYTPEEPCKPLLFLLIPQAWIKIRPG
jgi:hypothetical protein